MIDFPRYLAAKVSVDDRALNRQVWEQLVASVAALDQSQPLRFLELGCGIGTMVERLLEWGLAERVDYLGIDVQEENIHHAITRLGGWASAHGFKLAKTTLGYDIAKGNIHWDIQFKVADSKTYQAPQNSYDLLIAQAFLDLIDIPKALPGFSRLLKPYGLFYFTINFDGETIFEPVADEAVETEIINLYHKTMDERRIAGELSGDSRTGRHLFTHLRSGGAQILAAGASDWVVYPGTQGYPADEAYFLECILDFFEDALSDHPGLDPAAFNDWLNLRRTQIQQNELTYIAHQLDFCGRF